MLFINANTTGKVVRPWPEQFLWPWFVSSVVQRLLRTGCSRNRKSISNATKIVDGDTCPVCQCSLDYDKRLRNRKEKSVYGVVVVHGFTKSSITRKQHDILSSLY